jgi:MFS family permease
LLIVTSYGHFMSHYNTLAFPAVVLPLMARLHLDMAGVLDLAFGQYLLFGLTALPWGLAADRGRPRAFMALFFGGAGLSGLAAAWFIDQPGPLALSLAGIGLFSGIYHPVGLGLISKGMSRLSLAMGYNGIFGNVGMAAAPLLTGLANHWAGPKGAYALLAGFNLLGLAVMAFCPLDEAGPAETRAKGTEPDRWTPFVILLVAMMLGGVAYQGATVILPAYFELRAPGLKTLLADVFSIKLSSNLVATGVTALIYLIGILGQWVGGRVGERYEARASYLVFHLLTLPPVFWMARAVDLGLLAGAIVYFFFLLGMQPVENTLVARLTPERFHHGAYGAKFVLTFGVAALAVKMVGAIEHHWGLTWVFPVLGLVSMGLVLTVLILMTRTGPVGGRRREPGGPNRAGSQGPSNPNHAVGFVAR